MTFQTTSPSTEEQVALAHTQASKIEASYGEISDTTLERERRAQIFTISPIWLIGGEPTHDRKLAERHLNGLREVSRIERWDIKPSGDLDAFINGGGYIQHGPMIRDIFEDGVCKLLASYGREDLSKALTDSDYDEEVIREVVKEFTWLEGILNRIASIDVRTNREWGQPYLARLNPEAPPILGKPKRKDVEWRDTKDELEDKMDTIPECTMYSAGGELFYSIKAAQQHYRETSIANDIESGFLRGASDDFQNEGSYVQHHKEASFSFKINVARAIGLVAGERQGPTIPLTEDTLTEAHVLRYIKTANSPIYPLALRALSIDDDGREWCNPEVCGDRHPSIKKQYTPVRETEIG
jgi:hypothetical protein